MRTIAVWVVLFLTVSVVPNDFPGTDNNNGIVITKKDDACFSLSHWTVGVYFNLYTIVHSCEILHKSVAAVQDLPLVKNAFKYKTRFVTSINRIKVATEKYCIEVDYFKQLLPRREKRAWIDLGGTVLQKVFGTAVNSDVTLLKSKLNQVKTLQNQILIDAKKNVIFSAHANVLAQWF